MSLENKQTKQTMIHSYYGILFSNKKEPISDIHNKMGRGRRGEKKNQCKKKKGYDPIYMIYQKRQNYGKIDQ